VCEEAASGLAATLLVVLARVARLAMVRGCGVSTTAQRMLGANASALASCLTASIVLCWAKRPPLSNHGQRIQAVCSSWIQHGVAADSEAMHGGEVSDSCTGGVSNDTLHTLSWQRFVFTTSLRVPAQCGGLLPQLAPCSASRRASVNQAHLKAPKQAGVVLSTRCPISSEAAQAEGTVQVGGCGSTRLRTVGLLLLCASGQMECSGARAPGLELEREALLLAPCSVAALPCYWHQLPPPWCLP
jgi:hypothetical protein